MINDDPSDEIKIVRMRLDFEIQFERRSLSTAGKVKGLPLQYSILRKGK
jgi:hypothetical protein